LIDFLEHPGVGLEATRNHDIAGPILIDLVRKGVLGQEVTPVFCGTAFKNKGVQLLLDAVVDYMPSPLDVPAIEGENPFKWQDLDSNSVFNGKRVVVFALPGAFTPTCSSTHLPGYEKFYDDLKNEGIENFEIGDENYKNKTVFYKAVYNTPQKLGA